MARDKEEELLDLPAFDKADFMRSEKNRAKAVVFFFLIGAALGLLAGYLFIIHLWYFAVILLFVFFLFNRFIMQALNLEMPKTTGQKIFLFAEFLLAFIIFWILFINPPISVVSGPQISGFQVQDSSGNWNSVSQISGNLYAWHPGDVSYRFHLAYIYPITSVIINESLYPGSPTLTNLQKVAHNVTNYYNSTSNHLNFNISTGFVPSSGKYLVIQIAITSHGKTTSYTYELTLQQQAAGAGRSEIYYTPAYLPANRAGVV